MLEMDAFTVPLTNITAMQAVIAPAPEFIGLNGNDHDTIYITVVIHSGKLGAKTKCVHFMRPTQEEAQAEAEGWLALNDFHPRDIRGFESKQELWNKNQSGTSYVAEIVTENNLCF